MFGKKNKIDKQQAPAQPSVQASVTAMPDIFYGGKDPNIYHAHMEQAPEKATPSPAEQMIAERKQELLDKEPVPAPVRHAQVEEKPILAKAQPGGLQKPTTVRREPEKKGNKGMILFIIFIFIAGIAGIVWYYLRLFRPQPIVPPVPPPPVVVEEPVTVPPPVVTVPEPIVAIDLPTSLDDDLLRLPRVLIVPAVDTDQDDVTDAEEETFNTDAVGADSDGDGYIDGLEVRNLYSPLGFAPTKIIDSGLVQEYVNPIWQYRVYYPVTWSIDAVDAQAGQVLMSTARGDFIEIRSFKKVNNETFSSWFVRAVSGEQFGVLKNETNRFQVNGYIRQDRLVSYYESDQFVFVLIYHTGPEATISYPHVMEMVFQSFRPTQIFVEIPEQIVLPREPEIGTGTEDASTTDSAADTDILSPLPNAEPEVPTI